MTAPTYCSRDMPYVGEVFWHEGELLKAQAEPEGDDPCNGCHFAPASYRCFSTPNCRNTIFVPHEENPK